MMGGSFQLKRATVEELPALRWLWQRANLSTVALERDLTDFYLLLDEDFTLLAAMGVHVESKEAWLHHLHFSHDPHDPELFGQFWERLRLLLINRGVQRAWTRQLPAAWRQEGFTDPSSRESLHAPRHAQPDQPGLLVRPMRDARTAQLIEKKVAELSALREVSDRHMAQQTQRIRRIAYTISAVFISLLVYLTLRGILTLPRWR